MMNWRAGSKVFFTEEEARQYAKDMLSIGALIGICKTGEEVTHRYVWGDFARTERV